MSISSQLFESRSQQWKHWVLTTGLPGIFSIYPFKLGFSLDICLGVGLNSSTFSLFVGFFLRNLSYSPRWLHQFYISTNSVEGFPFFHTPPDPLQYLLFADFCMGMNHMACRILAPQLGTECGPLQWKHWVLTTWPPRYFLILKYR